MTVMFPKTTKEGKNIKKKFNIALIKDLTFYN